MVPVTSCLTGICTIWLTKIQKDWRCLRVGHGCFSLWKIKPMKDFSWKHLLSQSKLCQHLLRPWD
jgi:hypothetical protein